MLRSQRGCGVCGMGGGGESKKASCEGGRLRKPNSLAMIKTNAKKERCFG